MEPDDIARYRRGASPASPDQVLSSSAGGDAESPASDFEFFEAADLMPSSYTRSVDTGVLPAVTSFPDAGVLPLQTAVSDRDSGAAAAEPSGAHDEDHTFRMIESDILHATSALSRRMRNRGACSRCK